MKTRDERMAIMNEVLGSMRMLKFMAWERKFESKISEIRERELKYQRMSYLIEVRTSLCWSIVVSSCESDSLDDCLVRRPMTRIEFRFPDSFSWTVGTLCLSS